ncbi:hypothetical protein GALMADRAFT_141092 [Galerina marginata CBS 339.88]|uniref:SET domain-containing protein n=1 Tax=Galerina marginata (strain CBS 339.88) TaxID=685588 RepID=A0A067T477_GALM3|nr:hypothetical protein GALMADRAFT_141092 [Galerina marginata CBS 339.88]
MQKETPITKTTTRLVYGKVENTGIPEDYQPSSFKLVETDPSKIDHPENTIVLNTIPVKPINEPPDPDGHSQWIVLAQTKRKILDLSDYPQPVPRPVGPPAYVVRRTPTMGMGVFATRDIKIGDLIFSERPLLVIPRNLGSLGIRMPEGYDNKTHQMITMFEWEKQLEIAVNRMNPEDQSVFRSLANNHTEDGSGPLLGIVRTNGYSIYDLYDGRDRHPEDATAYTGVANIGSRINHSCMPNVAHDFSLPSFSFQFTARRDITTGEQLFFAYCALNQSVARRQAELAPYGIVCECTSCANATPETDKFREEYEQRLKDCIREVVQLIAAPHVTENALDPVLQFRKMLIQEGLHIGGAYASLLLVIHQLYVKLGLPERAKNYLEEYERYRSTAH